MPDRGGHIRGISVPSLPWRTAKVPAHWCGMTKDGIWTCGACADPEGCLATRCKRATDEDFKRGDRAWQPNDVTADDIDAYLDETEGSGHFDALDDRGA